MAYKELSEPSGGKSAASQRLQRDELCQSQTQTAKPAPQSYTPDLKLNHSKGALSSVRRGGGASPNAFGGVRLRVHGQSRFGRVINTSYSARSGRFGGG